MRSGIYFILNKISLKLYIGSAIYLVKRRSEHFTRLSKNIHHNEHLQRAYNKYGPDAFEFIIVELVEVSNLYEKERYYIAKHKATEEYFGYNKCEVGSGMTGRKHSAETKRKISESNKGKVTPQERKDRISETLKSKNLKMTDNHKEKLIAANRARTYEPVSNETRELMSKNRKGKKWSENRRNAVKSLKNFPTSTPINY